MVWTVPDRRRPVVRGRVVVGVVVSVVTAAIVPVADNSQL